MSIREEYYKLKNKNIAPLPENKKKESFLDFLGKSLSTGAYGLSKIGTGVLQGAENIADFTTHTLGQGIGSAVGLINKEAGENVKEFAKRSAEHDIIDTLLTQHVDKVYGENSYAKDIVGGVASSIGEMIPSVILGGGVSKALQGSKILADMSTKGKVLSKTANMISKTSGMLPFMAGATGSSVNEALDNGANYDEALKYGALSGASEGAIEGLFGGIGGLAGKGVNGVLNNKIVNKVINTTAIKEGLTKLTNTALGKTGVKIGDITINGLGEGVEEVASAILNPYLKRLTYDEQAELASNEDLMENFTMGVLTSVLFQGGASILQNSHNKSKNDNNGKLFVEDNKMGENGNVEQISQLLKTDNEKINNFRNTVSKYLKDDKKTVSFVNTVEKVIQDKNYNVLLDDKIGKNVNGKITTLENGEVEIKINPKSERAGEFILMHEVTHAIETKEINDLIVDYASKHTEFSKALDDLKKTYKTEDVSSEVVADISGQLFGNQEFINNLSMEKPSIFKRIYNKIIEVANKITGNSNEALFIRDLKNKWEEAYRTQGNNMKNSLEYSIAGKKGMENAIKHDSNNIALKKLYNQAQQMKKNGIDNETIRRKTDWFQDKNGDWKFEFTDKHMSLKSSINLKANADYKLGDILQHKTLFMVYPQLKDYNVSISEIGNKNGAFSNKYKTIRLSNELLKNFKSLEGTLIHEIQHAIQYIEGFETGRSSKKSKLAYLNSLGEIEAADTKNRFYAEKYNHKNIDNIAPESSKATPRHTKLDIYLKNRGIVDKIKDSVYNYFNQKGGKNHDENFEDGWSKSEENLPKDRYGNQTLVDEGRRVSNQELENSSSFSMNNQSWRDHVEQNYKATGTRTVLKNQLAPLPKKKKKSNNVEAVGKNAENETIVQILPKNDESKQNKRGVSKEKIEKQSDNGKIKTTEKESKNEEIAPTKSMYSDVLPPEMRKNRKWRDTVKNSEVLDQEMIRKVIKENREAFEYVPQSNVKQVEEADSKIKLFGYEKSIESINSIYESGKNITAVDLAMAQRLLQEASKRGDYKTTSELLPKVAIMGTELGQAVQSLSIIKRLSPAGQLKYIQATLNRIKKNELDKIKDNKIEDIEKIKNIKITEEMTEKILSTKSQQELNQAVSEVVNEIASKLPVSFFEKVDTWRYLSMLGNARTHIRNVIGNISMYGVRKVKDTLAAGIEDFVAKSNPNLIKERTKTLAKSTEYIKQFAKEQAKIAQNELSGQSKYTMENAIQRAKKAFGTEGFGGFIQKLADKNSSLLEFEDTIFKGKAYKKAFSDYLTANGMKNQQDIDNNPNLVKNANEYAVEEAMKATFQQYSALASLINRFENKNAGTKVIVGATVPFKKTPINIAKTGASYSPLGLAKSITYDLYKLNTGKITTPQFIDNISQGLTGISIMAIGIALFNLGILNPGSDDDKEGKYEKALGKQEYSVKIGDKTFTLDWLSPVAMPLFAGAELAKSLTNDGETKIESISNMLTSTLDPMMSMSVLQGINDALNGFEENKIQSILENSISGYVSQMFPTLFGQFNKTIDDTVRTTSVSKDSSFGLLEKIVRTNMNKIPGMSFLLEPSTDVWGNEVKRTENIIERAVDNFLMPYNVKTDSTSTIDTELKKVYSESGNDKVIPTVSLSKTITYGGENYKTNSSSYTQYKKTYGQEASDKLEKLFKTGNYQKASYEEKAKMISEVYEYAKDEAKKEFLNTKNVKYTNKTKDGVKIYEKNPIIDAINSNISYKEAVYKRDYPSKYKVITSIADYQTYQKYNAEIQEIENKYKGKGTKYSTQKKNEIISTVNSYKLNILQKAMLIKQYYSSYKDYDEQIVKYINSQKLNIEQKSEILTELGFTVNNGKVVY